MEQQLSNYNEYVSSITTISSSIHQDWPKAQLPLGDSSRRLYNYRQSRGRKNFTAYYYSELGGDESVEDDEWVHAGGEEMELRRATAADRFEDRVNHEKKAFTGFSGLGNLFLKKDKKDVVVAVVDDREGGQPHGPHHKHKPHKWSSEEHGWKPDNDQNIGAVIVMQNDETKGKNRFYQFFDNIGNKFNSVFKKKPPATEQQPVYQVNLNNHYYESSEEDHHHQHHNSHNNHHASKPHKPHHHEYRPTTYVAPSWYSSEESEDDRWHPTPKPSKNKKRKHQQNHYPRPNHGDIPLYYDSEESNYHPGSGHQRPKKTVKPFPYDFDEKYSVTPNKKKPSQYYYEEERNLHSDARSESVVDTTKDKQDKLAALFNKNTDNDDTPIQIQLVEKAHSSEEAAATKPAETVKPIVIDRPYNFISVHNVRFDKCGRLWFVDVGTVETASNPIFYHNPILWAFEVKVGAKGALISRPYLRYELEDSKPMGLRSLVVDIHETCDDYHVYMPNSKDNRVVVYSSEEGEHWQFDHPSLAPVLKETTNHVKDVDYELIAGVYSLTLGARDVDGFRDVYYTPAAGTGQFKVTTKLLRNREAAPNNFNPKSFKFVGYRGTEGLTRAQVYDPRTDVLFTASAEEQAIKCWNTKKLLTPDNFGTAYMHEDMVYGVDIKVRGGGQGGSIERDLLI